MLTSTETPGLLINREPKGNPNMRHISRQTLTNLLTLHQKWLQGEEDGTYADLRGADFKETDLKETDLMRANLMGANLMGANLMGANLSNTNLRNTNLIGANLRNANLGGADFMDANLRNTDLTGADLKDADFTRADLTGAVFRGAEIPIIPQIDAAILAAIGEKPNTLRMNTWHTCHTTHCRAGWAITLAGEAGAALEAAVGPAAAGALIYAVSRPDMPVPNFYTTNKKAFADIAACAAAASIKCTTRDKGDYRASSLII